ncbi:MAG: DUF503 domain-containing protein [bacterium]
MFICTSKVTIDTSFCYSLKEKRSIIQKIKSRTRNKFNVSISEIEYQNEWHKAQLGIAIVASESKYTNSIINKVVDFIDDMYPGLLEDWDLDIDSR